MTGSARDKAPAIVFLVLYSAVFALLVWLYATKAVRWRSRYSFVLFHVTMRLVGMALGVAFSCLEWQPGGGPRLSVLIAYLVFSAEGYFSLILCVSRFLIVWQQDRLGRSNLEPRIPKGTPRRERFRLLLAAPMTGFEYNLIAANALIVSGSSIMTGTISNPDGPKAHRRQTTGKAMRIAGIAIFIALVQVVALVGWLSYRKRGDRTLSLILLTWPLLTVRGIYGILAVVLPSWNYSNAAAYSSTGFSTGFLLGEYLMGIATEWLSCVLLLATHFSALNGGYEMREDHHARDRDKLAEEDGEELGRSRETL
ncbi:hypothetical protein JCM10908_000004 [Rhodotorula pacifica]|uniref:uncharacterized protein n=1 Tax=Rhodotorula pacifica TaxID=1495444 RepID=UPI0031730510